MTNQREYVLGHSPEELARLELQSTFYQDQTERFLRLAGIASGHRVLDVGCGVGDVAFVVATLVGPRGRVLAMDRTAAALETARLRAQTRHCSNVLFEEGDVTAPSAGVRNAAPFDAVVGRFVLMYMADPVATLRDLSALAPGGIVAFLEMDLVHPVRAWPAVPVWDSCMAWIRETYVRARIEPDPGLKLRAWFNAAGLAPHVAEVMGRVEGGPDSPAYAYIASTVRSLLPMMERFGVVRACDVDVDTLASRLRDEVVRTGAAMHLPLLVGVAAHMGSSVNRDVRDCSGRTAEFARTRARDGDRA